MCHWSFFLNWKSVRNLPIIILTVFESYHYLRVFFLFFNKHTVVFMDHRFNYSKMTCYSFNWMKDCIGFLVLKLGHRKQIKFPTDTYGKIYNRF